MLNTLTRSAVVRPLVLLVTIALSGSVAISQEHRAVTVQLIPEPRQIVVKPEVFRLERARIVLADRRSEEDRFAVTDFTGDVQETASLAIKISTSGSRHSILVGRLDLPPVQAALKKTGVSVPANLDPEGYVLLVNPNEVVVAGKTAA